MITNNTAVWKLEVTGLIDKIDAFRISTGGNYSIHGNLTAVIINFLFLLSSLSYWALLLLLNLPVSGLIALHKGKVFL
jgi:hypothetical protein